jgi:hypothetical protein
MKLEELAQKLGVALEELEIDGLGKVVGLPEQLSKAAQYQQELEKHQRELEQTRGYLTQYQQWASTIAAQQNAQQPQRQQYEWETDPLLQPLAPTVRQIAQQFDQMQRYVQQIEKVGREQFNRYEIDRLKRAYPDFDPDRVREYAVRTNDARSWEDVYHSERGSRVEDIVKERLEAQAKDYVGEKRRRLAEVHTEVEGATPRAGPKRTPPTYDQAFDNLENAFAEELGFG